MKFNVAINDTSSLCGEHKLLFFPMISSVRYEISTVHIVYAVFFYCYHGGYIEVLTGTGKANGTAERSFIEDVCFMQFFVDIVNYSS